MVYFAQIHSNLLFCILMWDNMTQRSDLNKLQKLQNHCVQIINPSTPLESLYKDLRIININEMLKLENYKLWYKIYKELLPAKLQSIMSVRSSHETLIKTHNYNTHRKGELNSPRAFILGYRKSFLIKGLADFSSLPRTIKKFSNIEAICKAV